MAAVAACTPNQPPRPARPRPAFYVRTQGVDGADHFMAGNARIAQPRHEAFDEHGVAMANSAGVYAEADLMTARLRQVALLHAEAPAGLWTTIARISTGGSAMG